MLFYQEAVYKVLQLSGRVLTKHCQKFGYTPVP